MKRLVRPGVLALVLSAGAAAASAAGGTKALPVPPDVLPKIDVVVSPLATVPAFVADGGTLAIELDPAARLVPLPEEGFAVSIRPSFGAAREATPLALSSVETGAASRLWPGRTVTVLRAVVPSFGTEPDFLADLYDLHVSWPTGADHQPRAVAVVDEPPASPRVVILADPSVGDPRPIQEGAEDLRDTGSPEPLLDFTLRTFDVAPGGRGAWAALRKAVEEINLVRPDFVLLAGDLTFGVHPRAHPYEYADAWEIVNRLRVPTFASPGNHDLYAADYYSTDEDDLPYVSDGVEMWLAHFGPLHWAIDLWPGFHLVSLNTFDWSARQPFALPSGETVSGGQVSDTQLAWLAADLAAFRAAHPLGTILTFAHHDPSWRQRRHPWSGANRLELRELFRQHRVAAHFAGHKHNDRVARYHGSAATDGNVVETPDQGGPALELHYLRPDDTFDEAWSQAALEAILRDPSEGTLFFTTTTAASGIKGPDWGVGGYWGWRLGTVRPLAGGGLDPADWGYPATRAFLDETAQRPERWNEAHADVGLFSWPSWHLDETTDGRNDGSEPAVTKTVASRLLAPLDVTVPLSVAAPSAGHVTVSGGAVVGARASGGKVDLLVATTVPAGGTVTVTAAAE